MPMADGYTKRAEQKRGIVRSCKMKINQNQSTLIRKKGKLDKNIP
jgi:hypothetical protein